MQFFLCLFFPFIYILSVDSFNDIPSLGNGYVTFGAPVVKIFALKWKLNQRPQDLQIAAFSISAPLVSWRSSLYPILLLWNAKNSTLSLWIFYTICDPILRNAISVLLILYACHFIQENRKTYLIFSRYIFFPSQTWMILCIFIL